MPRVKLSNVSIVQLMAEVKKRQGKLKNLIAQRDALTAEIELLQGAEAPIAAAATTADPTPARRGRKGRATRKPLAEYVKEALATVPKGIRDIEKAVLAAGYPTKAKSLYKQIGTVLGKGGFKKIKRGVYGLAATLKAAAAAPAKATKAPKAAKAKAPGKRRKFAETGEQFVLGLLKSKALKTSELTKAWAASGRGGKAENILTRLVQAKKVTREKLKGAKGSTYTLA